MTKSVKNKRGKPIWLTVLGLLSLSLLVAVLLRGHDLILFNPKGLIADQQHQLMVVSTLIMVGFAAPILFALYFFAWKYRESNDKSHFRHDAGRSKALVVTAWVSPLLVAIVLAALMLPATQKLEPKDPIENGKEPLTIQVVAMRWKWLFVYPKQNIATVNYVQIPVDTPVRFELTADETPMSSFWIPHLAGMLYAMTEHVNTLNLIADTVGDYEGGAAEINGRGFADMRFVTRVSTQADFDKWVGHTLQSPFELTDLEYAKLLTPSEDNPPAFYSNPGAELYGNILSKYGGSHGGSHGHQAEVVEYGEHEGH